MFCKGSEFECYDDIHVGYITITSKLPNNCHNSLGYLTLSMLRIRVYWGTRLEPVDQTCLDLPGTEYREIPLEYKLAKESELRVGIMDLRGAPVDREYLDLLWLS